MVLCLGGRLSAVILARREACLWARISARLLTSGDDRSAARRSTLRRSTLRLSTLRLSALSLSALCLSARSWARRLDSGDGRSPCLLDFGDCRSALLPDGDRHSARPLLDAGDSRSSLQRDGDRLSAHQLGDERRSHLLHDEDRLSGLHEGDHWPLRVVRLYHGELERERDRDLARERTKANG